MLRNRLVFVLGAGASRPYGYPTARELVQSIVTGSLSDNSALKGRSDFEAFKNALGKAKARSVDIFLARDKLRRFEAVGPLAIAENLICQESDSKLFVDEVEDDWYEYLFHTLLEDITDINDVPAIPVSFVTFNYDRSLEHFVHTYLMHNFADAHPAEVVNVISQMRIIHVYGYLGPLLWQDPENGRDYSPEINPDIVERAAKNITILHQGDINGPELQLAQAWCQEADSILMLGFGYHPDNMRRLNLPFIREHVPAKVVTIWGTTFRMTEAECSRLRVIYGNRWTTSPPSLQICDSLRNYGDFVQCVSG